MGILHEIGMRHHTDKAYDHNFMDFYEMYFKPIRHQKINLLEIGIWNGESLKTFNEYFTEGQIYGFDIMERFQFAGGRIHVERGDQSNKTFLKTVFPDVKEFDIIIDDGSHVTSHQQISLGSLFPRLKSGGIYIIEDLHTSFVSRFCTISDCSDSTVKFLYSLDLKKPSSAHMTQDELQYLLDNVKLINVFTTRADHKSITSIILKK